MSQLQQPPASAERETTFIPFGSKETIRLSVSIVKTLLCNPSKNGSICSDRDAIKFIMLCKAKGLNPFENDAYLIGYDNDDGTASFSLITAHQAFLKRAEVHPEYDGMESGVIVRTPDGSIVDREGDFFFEPVKDGAGNVIQDGDFLLGAWAIVHFKNRKHPMRKRIRFSTFSTGKARWKADPAGMICKVAEADALRSSFPTLLGAMYLEQEVLPPERDVTPVPETPKQLPVGRSKIGKEKAIAAPVQEPVQAVDVNVPSAEPEKVPATHADGEIIEDKPAAAEAPRPAGSGPDELFDDLCQSIDQATTTKQLDTIRNAYRQTHRYTLGEALYAKLVAICDAKYKAVLDAQPKKAK